ncbi:MAG: MBL fold metallo-hydrolase, partial [Gammaproteobacteria bacterium]
ATAGELAPEITLTEPGKKLVYATDLADTPDNRARLVRLASKAHTLFCEAPFVRADAEQARRTGHLTTRACGEIATAADVVQLIPFHFSRRYSDDIGPLYREIATVCSRLVTPAVPQSE